MCGLMGATFGAIGPEVVVVVVELPPKALRFLASLKAIATACFWGRPLWISSLILELTVALLLPFLSGMVYPGEYVTLMD